jgi:enamine deaminase RidA (YjgF/YER057c/UK114 family)
MSDSASGSASARAIPINPVELGAPSGYSNGLLAPAGGRLLFVAGQVGWTADHRFPDGFIAQLEQALGNVVAVVGAAGGQPADIYRLTIYVVDKREYLADLRAVGQAYRRIMGRHFPTMALVEVSALVEDAARIEIEATAVLPADHPDPAAALPIAK